MLTEAGNMVIITLEDLAMSWIDWADLIPGFPLLFKESLSLINASVAFGSKSKTENEVTGDSFLYRFKAMGEPMCLITSDEFKALAQSDRGALKYIGWMQEDQESHTAIYAKGVGYDWSTQITPVAGSTFDKVFVSCTDLDDNKVNCADQL